MALMNPSGTKTFAWMRLDHVQKTSPIAFNVCTSDEKSLQYKTLKFREVDYICDVKSRFRPEESNSFVKARKRMGARMQRMNLGGKLQFEASYYTPSDEEEAMRWFQKKTPCKGDKVRALHAPLGQNGEMLPFAQFVYHHATTDVRDVDGHLIRYTHDKQHLLSIEYFNGQGQVASILKFLWDKERLKAKVMLDGQSRAHFSKTFSYDDAGNVTQEILWGALTGAVTGPFSINGDGSLAGAEHYAKRYEYLPRFNIPLVEKENGLTYRYLYKNDTDLPIAKFTCQGTRILMREFLYNEDNLVVAETTDDGALSDPGDDPRSLKPGSNATLLPSVRTDPQRLGILPRPPFLGRGPAEKNGLLLLPRKTGHRRSCLRRSGHPPLHDPHRLRCAREDHPPDNPFGPGKHLHLRFSW